MKKKVEFNVLEAIYLVSKKLKKSQLKDTKLTGIKSKIKQLNKYFKTTSIETLFFVSFFALNKNLSKAIKAESVAEYLDCEWLEILLYSKDLLSLLAKQLIVFSGSSQKTSFGKKTLSGDDTYVINTFVEQAILENKSLPKNIDVETATSNEDFVVGSFFFLTKNAEVKESFFYEQTKQEIKAFEKEHENLSIVIKTKKIVHDFDDRLLFYAICCASVIDKEDVSLKDSLELIYPTSIERIRAINSCKEKIHPLFKMDLVQFIETPNLFDLDVELTENGLDIFLDEYTRIFHSKHKNDVIECESIADKTLFFKPELEKQVNFLTSTLEETSFKNLRARLEKEKFPQGVCALFYGSPGTGKTETVYQLAKSTGRAIVHVDISQSKSMWFGESEKKIKKIFQDYKRLCKECDIKPILLFNEADAIFSKRKESHTSSVAQTENAMQNIILEEMEKLDGILIATTNLTGNLDAAFERRFLFKIEFEKPTVEAKINIWKSKMPKLSKKNATVLANAYDFSGGEIDNIVRKCIIDEVISGKKATLEDIETLCKQEHIHKQSEGKRIGFGAI